MPDDRHVETGDDGRDVIVTEHEDGNVTYVQDIDPINDVPDVTSDKDG